MKDRKIHNLRSGLRLKTFTSLFGSSVILSLMAIALIIPACTGRKPYVDKEPQQTLNYLADSTGILLEINFQRGRYHNHPLMVFWLEDESGKYLRTLYVARSIGEGVFRYGSSAEGFWKPGEIQRPAALPHWGHQRGVKNEFGNMIPSPSMPVPDAITGPTPKHGFVLKTWSGLPLPDRFVLKMEINQTWDFNEFWTNAKFPGNDEYITSCQPALVYAATIDRTAGTSEFTLTPIGHSHYDGSDGSLTTDLSTITTALDIAREVKVKLVR
jgi:hypothetical protein